MNKKIIIFIDALSYEYTVRKGLAYKLSSELSSTIRLIPELGYSSNQHMALFAGQLPKDSGYLGDYSLVKKLTKKPFKQKLTHNSFLNFFIKRFTSIFSGKIDNIPIGLGHLFINDGVYPLKDFNSLVQTDHRYKRYQFHDIQDFEWHEKFIKSIDPDKDQFIVINQIDHAGHVYGTEDTRYEKLVYEMTSFLSKFLERFGKNSSVVILSDHGMSNKPIKTKLQLESIAGKQSQDSYIYFVDSSVCKVWYFDNDIKIKIRKYFNSHKRGLLLTEQDKDYWGVDGSICDDVFVLDSKYYFEPQYFGFGIKSKTLGMHGSLPNNEDQHGVLLSNINIPNSSMRNKDVFTWFIENNFL